MTPPSDQGPSRLSTWAGRHEYAAAALFLAAVISLYFIPFYTGHELSQNHVLWTEVPWIVNQPDDIGRLTRSGETDAVHTFYPMLVVARAQIHSGHVPLWNPFSYAGSSLLGDMQSALLFPLTWLAFILPLKFAWSLMAMLKLLMAGLGAYALARQLSVGRRGGLVAGVVYMLSAPLIVFLQSPQGTVFALLPWLFLATDRLYRRRDSVRVVQLAFAALLVILAGHPESAALAFVSAALYFLVLAARDGGVRHHAAELARNVGAWLGAMALGIVAGAAALIPFLQAYLASADRLEHHLQGGSYLSPHLGLLYAVPTIYGDGQPNVYLYTPLPIYISIAGYFGIVALTLALIALVRGRRRPDVQAMATVGIVAALVFFDVPPFSTITRHLPPFDKIVVQRVYVFVALAGAIGAGAAFTSLSKRGLSRRTLAWIALAGVLVVGVWLLVEQLSGRLVAPDDVKTGAIARAALFFALGLLCIALLSRSRGIAPLLLVVAVCILDVSFLQPFNVWLPPATAYPPKAASLGFLQKQPGQFHVSTIRKGFDQNVFLPNAAAAYGLDGIEGHDPPVSKRWALFEKNVLGQDGLSLERLITAPKPTGASLTGLRLMNTRFYIAQPDADAPNPAFTTAYSGPDAKVFEDPGALPRAYVAPSIRKASDDDALDQLGRGAVDPRQVALVPPDAPDLPAGRRTFAAAESKNVTPDHVRVTVPGGTGGWLVLADAYSPHWRAKVDGHSVKLRPTNYAAMGVPLPPGRHTVDFQLSHTGFNIGVAITLASLAGMGLVLLRARRRRPR